MKNLSQNRQIDTKTMIFDTNVIPSPSCEEEEARRAGAYIYSSRCIHSSKCIHTTLSSTPPYLKVEVDTKAKEGIIYIY